MKSRAWIIPVLLKKVISSDIAKIADGKLIENKTGINPYILNFLKNTNAFTAVDTFSTNLHLFKELDTSNIFSFNTNEDFTKINMDKLLSLADLQLKDEKNENLLPSVENIQKKFDESYEFFYNDNFLTYLVSLSDHKAVTEMLLFKEMLDGSNTKDLHKKLVKMTYTNLHDIISEIQSFSNVLKINLQIKVEDLNNLFNQLESHSNSNNLTNSKELESLTLNLNNFFKNAINSMLEIITKSNGNTDKINGHSISQFSNNLHILISCVNLIFNNSSIALNNMEDKNESMIKKGVKLITNLVSRKNQITIFLNSLKVDLSAYKTDVTGNLTDFSVFDPKSEIKMTIGDIKYVDLNKGSEYGLAYIHKTMIVSLLGISNKSYDIFATLDSLNKLNKKLLDNKQIKSIDKAEFFTEVFGEINHRLTDSSNKITTFQLDTSVHGLSFGNTTKFSENIKQIVKKETKIDIALNSEWLGKVKKFIDIEESDIYGLIYKIIYNFKILNLNKKDMKKFLTRFVNSLNGRSSNAESKSWLFKAKKDAKKMTFGLANPLVKSFLANQSNTINKSSMYMLRQLILDLLFASNLATIGESEEKDSTLDVFSIGINANQKDDLLLLKYEIESKKANYQEEVRQFLNKIRMMSYDLSANENSVFITKIREITDVVLTNEADLAIVANNVREEYLARIKDGFQIIEASSVSTTQENKTNDGNQTNEANNLTVENKTTVYEALLNNYAVLFRYKKVADSLQKSIGITKAANLLMHNSGNNRVNELLNALKTSLNEFEKLQAEVYNEIKNLKKSQENHQILLRNVILKCFDIELKHEYHNLTKEAQQERVYFNKFQEIRNKYEDYKFVGYSLQDEFNLSKFKTSIANLTFSNDSGVNLPLSDIEDLENKVQVKLSELIKESNKSNTETSTNSDNNKEDQLHTNTEIVGGAATNLPGKEPHKSSSQPNQHPILGYIDDLKNGKMKFELEAVQKVSSIYFYLKISICCVIGTLVLNGIFFIYVYNKYLKDRSENHDENLAEGVQTDENNE